MGIGGFSEKDINITNGGGSIESWLPAMLMNNKNGGLGGDNNLLLLFIILFGFGGYGGLGGFGNRGAAASVATDLGLSNASLIDTTKTAIAASTGTIINAIDKGTASINSNIDNKFAIQTADLTNQFTMSREKVAEGFQRSENGLQILNSLTQLGFDNLNKSFCDLEKDNCARQNALLNSINCSTQSIKDGQNAGFQALSSQNAQLMNAINAVNCNMNSQFKDISCQIATSTRDIIQNQKDIQCQQAAVDAARREADYRDRIAKLEANCDHHSRREYESNNISINNQIAILNNNMNTLINALSGSNRPGNGNGNS